MKQIPYVAPVAVVGLEGAKSEQPAWNHFDFLCGRISDNAFAGSRIGTEAIFFCIAARKELGDQRQQAEQRGFWIVEDERGDALARATERPQNNYKAYLALTLEPFLLAQKAMSDYKPEAK